MVADGTWGPLDLQALITVVGRRWAWNPESGEVRHGLGCSSARRQQGLTTLFRHVAVKEGEGPLFSSHRQKAKGELGIRGTLSFSTTCL